jgi:hypothetical protein
LHHVGASRTRTHTQEQERAPRIARAARTAAARADCGGATPVLGFRASMELAFVTAATTVKRTEGAVDDVFCLSLPGLPAQSLER